MLMFARIVAGATALIAVVNIAVGAMTDPDFLVPDLLLAALLAATALVPARLGVTTLLGAALAFALGVFSVALSGQVVAGETNVGLAALMVADLAALAGLGLRASRPAG
jgi:hypothetical protein